MITKIFFSILILSSLPFIEVVRLMQPLSQKLQKTCQQQSKKNKFRSEEVAAIICGKKINNPQLKDIFISTGIIHIFVISGTHLHFYKKFFYLLLPKKVSWLITCVFLFFYTITCKFSAPITRTFAEFIFEKLNSLLKLNWSKSHLTCFAGVFCLLLNPKYLKSYSLPLSWAASLCMGQKNGSLKGLLVFFIILPILLCFSSPNLLSALSGYLLTSLVSLFILPTHLLTFLFPIFNPIINEFYNYFLGLLELIQPSLQTKLYNTNNFSSRAIPWLYTFTLNISLILFNTKTNKEK